MVLASSMAVALGQPAAGHATMGKKLDGGAPADADAEAQRLAAAIGRGEDRAFEEFYNNYEGRLFRFLLVLGHGDETLARDVLQSAMLTTARKLRRVETEAHLWHWLARVARQHLIKEWRRRGREPMLVNMPELPETPDERTVDRVLEEQLEGAIVALDPQDRETVEWFYFDGLSCEEIGVRLGTTAKAVSSRLERVREKLRALVQQETVNNAKPAPRGA
ncbi:MAG: hypothetical protein C5B50_06065 [Verrucomicrobia bacterium]|nr:MAG: hypothetical protein C5B50_06065 [Verrucomicrobiota bacterium]